MWAAVTRGDVLTLSAIAAALTVAAVCGFAFYELRPGGRIERWLDIAINDATTLGGAK